MVISGYRQYPLPLAHGNTPGLGEMETAYIAHNHTVFPICRRDAFQYKLPLILKEMGVISMWCIFAYRHQIFEINQQQKYTIINILLLFSTSPAFISLKLSDPPAIGSLTLSHWKRHCYDPTVDPNGLRYIPYILRWCRSDHRPVGREVVGIYTTVPYAKKLYLCYRIAFFILIICFFNKTNKCSYNAKVVFWI